MLERSLIFRLLLEAIDSDPELQAAQMLTQLVTLVEKETGPDRAALMALSVSEKIAESEDFVTATGFFRTYMKNIPRSLPHAAMEIRGARLGTALAATKAGRTLVRGRKKWDKTLRSSGLASVFNLYRLLPKNVDAPSMDRLNAFLDANANRLNDREFLTDLRLAIGTLKGKALNEKKFRILLNLSMLRNKLTNALAHGNMNPDRLRYRDLAGDILKRLPAGQSFRALADTGEEATVITLENGGVSSGRLKQAGRYLRGKLSEYLDRLHFRHPSRALNRELSQTYRSIFGISQTGVLYYWFEGLHAYAPIGLQRGDRLFMVTDPDSFAKSRVRRTGDEFPSGFSVSISGSRRYDRSVSAEKRNWMRRIDDMERLSLGSVVRSGAPTHIMADVSPKNVDSFVSSVRGDPSPWFVSRGFVENSPEEERRAMLGILERLGTRFSGPGVVTLVRPRDVAHPYFVRYFYNRSSPFSSIHRRFTEAFLNLKRTVGDDSAIYGYRLVTGSFLTE